MKKFLLLFSSVLLFILTGCSTSKLLNQETINSMKAKQTNMKLGDMKYLLYLPEDYDGKKEYPLVIFLHGSGEKGDSLALVKRHGIPMLIAKGQQFPFIMAAPQCKDSLKWDIKEVHTLYETLVKNYNIDKDRFYLTGISMGGYGTWDFAVKYPELLAAIIPICGGGDTSKANNLKDIAIWAFHGARDNVVPPESSKEMIEAAKKFNNNVKFTLYPNANHNSWTMTYNNPEIYTWMLAQRRK